MPVEQCLIKTLDNAFIEASKEVNGIEASREVNSTESMLYASQDLRSRLDWSRRP